VNRDLSFYSSYSLSGEDGRSRQINLHTGFQGVTDNLSNPAESRNSRMFFANLSMTARTASKWQYTFGLDLNQNWLPFNRSAAALKLNSRWGANAAIMKSLLKDKCNLSLGSNFFYAFQPLGEQSNYIFNHYFRNNWRIGKKHSLNFQLNLMQSRPQGTGSERAFSELIGSLGYNTQFGWTPSSKR
jgi:hypothetical protein